MSAAADYARVVDAMQRPLPAYVSYVERDAMRGLTSSEVLYHIVVETAGGKVVHGDATRVYLSGFTNAPSTPVATPAFDPKCYHATREETTVRNRRATLAFTLSPNCPTAGQFKTLVVDRATMRPIEAIGMREGGQTRVSIDETYGSVRGWSLPATLRVDIEGRGLMFWLQMHVTQTFSSYGFYATDPGPGTAKST
jgi:hypothetical protein